MEKKSSRIKEIDILKGIAILFVLVGHYYENNAVKTIIHSFHMPLFVFMSGIFLKKIGVYNRIKHGFKLYMIPYAISLIITIMLECFINVVTRDGDLYSLIVRRLVAGLYALDSISRVNGLPQGVINVGVIWFLFALFTGTIYWELIKKSNKIIVNILLLIILWGIGYLITLTYCLPLALMNGIAFCVWLYVGSLFRTQFVNDWRNTVYYGRGGVVLILVWGVAVYLEIQSGQRYFINRFSLPFYGIEVIGALAGIIVFLNLSCFIGKRCSHISKICSFLGRNSLFIMCSHAIDIAVADTYLYSSKNIKWYIDNWRSVFMIRSITDLGLGCVIALIVENIKNINTISPQNIHKILTGVIK